MQGINIVATGRALPENKVTNDDLSKVVETSDEWIKTRTGIEARYICKEETCASLAATAARKAIEQGNIKPEDIGIVVIATTTADYAFPSCACLVAGELGLDDEVMAFDISAACSGFIYGLGVMKGLLMQSKRKYGILVGSEKMSAVTDYTDRSTCVLFGDGAGAAIIELDNSTFIHRTWSRGDSEALICKRDNAMAGYIQMDGSQVFKFAVKVIREGIDAVLEEAQMTIEDIDYIVCHQANKRIIEHVSKKYGAPENKFYMNIAKYANTSAASIPIAIDELFEQKKLSKGMKIICVGFGAGFTWGSTLITI